MAAITKNHKNDYYGSQNSNSKLKLRNWYSKFKLKNLNSNFKTLTWTQNFKLRIKKLKLKKLKSKLKLRSFCLEGWSHGGNFWDFSNWLPFKVVENMIADGQQRSPESKLEFWVFPSFPMFGSIWFCVDLLSFRVKLYFVYRVEKNSQQIQRKTGFKPIW